MKTLSGTANGIRWINQFPPNDREAATSLIDEMLIVGRDDFSTNLRALLDDFISQQARRDRNMALYAERPIKKVFGAIPAFFPNSRRGRAEGPGVPPIIVDPRYQEVGSEGVVAQFITDYCRRNPGTALTHPGPTKLRAAKVRKIVVVTDFIGSGTRIHEMLESFRYVATLRSWHSYGLIGFVVVAYSGTEEGITLVRRHKLRPDVRIVASCPTIENAFAGNLKYRIEKLCRTYPKRHSAHFGFGNVSALIAFAHGCPNNVPAIIHSSASGWIPLFTGRSTGDDAEIFLPDNIRKLRDQRTKRLLGIRNARNVLAPKTGDRWILTMLILSRANEGVRTPEDMSSRTHLKLSECKTLMELARDAQWLNGAGRLTHLGRDELERLRRRRYRTPILCSGIENYYYPTQLRAP